jgi:hypothetical protein
MFPLLEEPTFRFFKGYFQRHFEYQKKPYAYAAGELNIPCPKGLSGAAVLLELGGKLCGLITRNIEVDTEISRFETISKVGETLHETTRDVIKYGVCLWLPPLASWLDSHIPPVPKDVLERRAKVVEWYTPNSG